MSRFNFRLLVALFTFGIGVFGASLLIFTFSVNKTSPGNLQELNLAPNEAQQNTLQTVSEVSDKVENFQFPNPTKNKLTKTLTKNFPSVNGKSVKVNVAIYYTTGKFLTDKPTDSISLNKKLGLCQIDDITVYKVKDKIFGFRFLAHRVELTEQEIQNWKGNPFYSKIYIDTDGDGNFESIPSGSEIEVPLWAIQ